jgi:hypothetical protein
LLNPRHIFACGATLLLAACVAPGEAPRRAPHRDVHLAAETETVESIVPRDATLDALLRAAHIQPPAIVNAIQAARGVFDPRQIRSGRPYRLVRSLDGLLREFVYEIDTDRFLRLEAGDRAHPDTLAAVREADPGRRDRCPDRARIVAHRRHRAERREHPAGARAGRCLRRADRFQQ